MSKPELHLTVNLAAGREAECAAYLHQTLRPPQWAILAALAAEIVSRWESAAAGQRVVVVAASEKGAAIEKALQVRVANHRILAE